MSQMNLYCKAALAFIVCILFTIPGASQDKYSEDVKSIKIIKFDDYISHSIKLSEKMLYDANFEDALNYVEEERFKDFSEFNIGLSVRLKIQIIRVKSFQSRLLQTPFEREKYFLEIKNLEPFIEKVPENEKAEFYTMLSSLYRSKNLDSCQFFEEKALAIFQETNNHQRLAEVRATKISRELDNHFSNENKEEALKMIPVFEEEIKFSERHSDYATAYNTRHLANIYRIYEVDLDVALRLYNRSLMLREKIGFKPFICASYFSVGLTYEAMSNFELAEEVYLESIRQAENVNFKTYKVRGLKNLGDMFYNLENKVKSEEYYKQFLKQASVISYSENQIDQVMERLKLK